MEWRRKRTINDKGEKQRRGPYGKEKKIVKRKRGLREKESENKAKRRKRRKEIKEK